MKKHLKYIDGASDKFWQIETVAKQFTVTYGKNGTSGVSQTKSFATEEECLKNAEKLLAEKIKKGYSENGEVVISTSKSKVTSEKKSDAGLILKEYDQLMLSGKKELLIPFLEQHSKGNIEVLKNHIKKCRKYWMTYIDLEKEPQYRIGKKYHWGTRGTDVQKEFITLSAIALFNKSDITSWDEAFGVLEKVDDPIVLELLQWTKPNWIEFFILDRIKKQEWTTFSYSKLRILEEHQLIHFNPELYALCLSSFSDWREKINTLDFINYISNDKVAYERDVPELFNYPTNLHNNFYKIKENEPYNSHSTWADIFQKLLEEKKMATPFFIENAILIQTKDWNNNLKSFFRKRIDELQLSSDDLIPFQDSIFPFLHNPYPPITTYGIELIKKIYEHPKFKTKVFLEWLEPTMMRSDCKASIKVALPILEKIAKANPKLCKTIASTVADIFVIADLSLQEKAARFIVKVGSKKDTDLLDKITGYAALIQGTVKSSLSALLDEEALAVDASELEEYNFNPQRRKVLLEEVQMPKDWNDIVYQFGSFITSDEVLDTELLMNVFITQRNLFPSDYSQQLKPYHKQLDKSGFDSIHKCFASVFFKHKTVSLSGRVKITDNTYSTVHTLKLIHDFINKVQDKISSNSTIPLLSFPTHKPYWVAPKVLLERIIEHQRTKESIMAVDLAVAIARMPRENIEEALPLLDKINGELKDILAFCLGVKKEISVVGSSFLNRFISTIGIASQSNDNTVLWAVAARTFYPNQTFETFDKTHLKGIPFVSKPFDPIIDFKEKWYDSVNYYTKEKERSPSWYELSFEQPKGKNTNNCLLYSIDVYAKEKSWFNMLNNTGNVYYWHSLMPQNNDPLAFKILGTCCKTADGGTADLKGFLTVVNQPGFVFSEVTTLVFACCFFMEKKEIRLLASEVLINLIDTKSIDINLLAGKMAYLASNKYGVFQRLAEGLAALKDVSALHNHALYLLVDDIFKTVNFKGKLPTNFKKILETYVDILSKTNQKPSPEAKVFFQQWKDNASLKSLLKEVIQ